MATLRQATVAGAVLATALALVSILWLRPQATSPPTTDVPERRSPQHSVPLSRAGDALGRADKRNDDEAGRRNATPREAPPVVGTLFVDVLDWDDKPVQDLDVDLFHVSLPGFLTYPTDTTPSATSRTGADGRAVFDALDPNSYVQVGIRPKPGLTVRFDARQGPFQHGRDGETMVLKREPTGPQSQFISVPIPIPEDTSLDTRVRIGREGRVRGHIALDGCESCSIQIKGCHRQVVYIVDSLSRVECGDFELGGLAPHEDYDLEVVCRSGRDYYFHWTPITLHADQDFTVPPISWAKPAYAIRLKDADLLPPKIMVQFLIQDTTNGHRYLFRATPGNRYNIGGVGALRVAYAGLLTTGVPGGSCFKLDVELAHATVGAPAVVRASTRN